MQARLTIHAFALAALRGCAAAPSLANTAFVSNEKGNSISVIDTATLEVRKTVKVGQRPRGIALSKDDSELFVCVGDDDTIQVLDTKTMAVVGELPSGPDPEQLRVSPDGTLVFVANENDALLTAIDVKTREVVTQFPVGVEPEGVAVSPDGAMVVNTSETTSMAHFIDWKAKKIVANILVAAAPAFRRIQARRLRALGVLGSRRQGLGHRSGQEGRHPDDRVRRAGTAQGADPAGRDPFHLRRQARLRRARPRQPRRGHRRGDQGGAQISAGRPARLAPRAHAGRQTPARHQRRLERRVGHRCRSAKSLEIDAVGSYPWGVAITRQ